MDMNTASGLSSSEVAAARKKFGYNELPDREKRSVLKIVVGLLTEPMLFVLVAIVIVYFFLGDRTEAFVLMVSVGVIIGINLFQDLKTEKALEALRNLASPTSQVIRDGEHVTLPSRELVPGDIVMISEGTRVPADGRLIEAQNVVTDESLLTGESLPVEKSAEKGCPEKQCIVYSSSMVVKGHGVAEVTAIGLATEVGKIGDSLNRIESEDTLLNKEVDRVVRIIAVIALSSAALITIIFWLSRGDLLNGFLAGLTYSIAVLPEEFPVVLTVFMALGAWRMAKNKVLTRKSSAIETLGSASVLCTDKTGTLTENRMQIQQVTDVNGQPLQADNPLYHHVVSFGVLASQIKPFDPMEDAFLVTAKRLLGSVSGIYNGYRILREYPLDEASLSVVHVWGGRDGVPVTIAAKGAPEALFKLCRLSEEAAKELEKVVKQFAREGLRVLAVAKGQSTSSIAETREEYTYDFLGLVALADPVRKEAAAAVELCRDAGVRVIMITGDYAETARRIGGEVGLDNEKVVTGEEFSQMSKREQEEAIRQVSIFSRVAPAHKLTIVDTLKRLGEVVAMTGDGVNDAPALKAAHIGIAMGNRGTDVAREASTIVLLDDNFASIVKGVRLGRRIFANLQKAMAYVLTVHMPIITLSLMPVVFGWPLVLLPIHIVFLEFIIDPSCTLVFESEKEDPTAMKRPPRSLGAPLFSRRMLLRSLLQGGVMSVIILATHFTTMQLGWPTDKSRALTFLLMVLTNLSMIIVLSGRREVRSSLRAGIRSPLLIVVLITLASLLVVYLVPPVTGLFKLSVLSAVETIVAVALSGMIALFVLPLRHILK